MSALLREIRTLPHIEGSLTVRVLVDETSERACCLGRRPCWGC